MDLFFPSRPGRGRAKAISRAPVALLLEEHLLTHNADLTVTEIDAVMSDAVEILSLFRSSQTLGVGFHVGLIFHKVFARHPSKLPI